MADVDSGTAYNPAVTVTNGADPADPSWLRLEPSDTVAVLIDASTLATMEVYP